MVHIHQRRRRQGKECYLLPKKDFLCLVGGVVGLWAGPSTTPMIETNFSVVRNEEYHTYQKGM